METTRNWLKTIVLALLLLSSNVPAQWTQWGGPNQNFTIGSVTISTEWPKDGPKEIWRRDLGDGYSAISVDNGILYTMTRRSGKEATVALNAADGKTAWEFSYDFESWSDFNDHYGPGPHSTPVVYKNYVYTVGSRTDFYCLNKTSGEKVWSQNLWEKYGSEPRGRGFSSSPMIYKNMLIIPSGGDGHGVIALKPNNGDIIWANQDFESTFSSPIIINVDGQDQLIVFANKYVTGLNPTNGELLWKHTHRTQYNINAMTPLWGKNNILFISSAYDGGSRGLRLSQNDGKTSVEELWYNRKMQIHHQSAVQFGDLIYGSSGDFGPAFLMAIKAETGKVEYQERGFAKANFLLAGDKLIILDENGQLAIASATADGLKVHSKKQVFTGRSWTAPTLIGTTLYLRDRKEILAIDLSF